MGLFRRLGRSEIDRYYRSCVGLGVLLDTLFIGYHSGLRQRRTRELNVYIVFGSQCLDAAYSQSREVRNRYLFDGIGDSVYSITTPSLYIDSAAVGNCLTTVSPFPMILYVSFCDFIIFFAVSML